ncbi:MAG TPA: hypothetical protein VGF60_01165 [Xanthobacteraceae bacterium]|jgi:hypothetical protein
MRQFAILLALAMALLSGGSAPAADRRFPDWPCNQVKVPELSVAAVWTGPSIEDVGSTWEEEPAIRDLVARLAARRTPLDAARKAIADFIVGAHAERQKKAKLVFAGLFTTLGNERGQVMQDIERYARRQREFAEQVRSMVSQLHELQDKGEHEQARIDELGSKIEWATRIFEERRKTIGFVCEVPVRIEQRLFALARDIQEAME